MRAAAAAAAAAVANTTRAIRAAAPNRLSVTLSTCLKPCSVVSLKKRYLSLLFKRNFDGWPHITSEKKQTEKKPTATPPRVSRGGYTPVAAGVPSACQPHTKGKYTCARAIFQRLRCCCCNKKPFNSKKGAKKELEKPKLRTLWYRCGAARPVSPTGFGPLNNPKAIYFVFSSRAVGCSYLLAFLPPFLSPRPWRQ